MDVRAINSPASTVSELIPAWPGRGVAYPHWPFRSTISSRRCHNENLVNVSRECFDWHGGTFELPVGSTVDKFPFKHQAGLSFPPIWYYEVNYRSPPATAVDDCVRNQCEERSLRVVVQTLWRFACPTGVNGTWCQASSSLRISCRGGGLRGRQRPQKLSWRPVQ